MRTTYPPALAGHTLVIRIAEAAGTVTWMVAHSRLFNDPYDPAFLGGSVDGS